MGVAGNPARQRHRWRMAMVAAAVTISACSFVGGDDDGGSSAPPPPRPDGVVSVAIEVPLAEISPLIRGVSGPIGQFDGAGVTFNSWGGMRATRYNYQLGNAWNLGRDGAFRNEGVASSSDLVGDRLVANDNAGIASRVAVPALGWIARDGDSSTCSFPDETGNGCLTAIGFDCETTGPIADPRRANVGSSPQTVAEWIGGYVAERLDIDYLAIDNEPERWGIDHYDVHPTCTDYFEILGTYVAYAEALRAAAPQAQLAGPVMCCWYDYADPPGPDDESDEDLLTWFLTTLRDRQDDNRGDSLLDVVDVHFRPQADVVNGRSDPETDAQRIAATRELWDPEHRAPGGGSEPIEFIPRLRRIIDQFFPGMPLMISDWTFGGEASMSGALAISEVLGVFAREGVHAAAHADSLEPGTPGFFAFKMFGNYDDRGGAFEGIAVDATTDTDDVDAYAAVERGSTLRVALINTSSDEPRVVELDLGGAETSGGSMYTYSAATPDEIVESLIINGMPASGGVIELPASSVSMVELRLRNPVDLTVPEDTVAGSSVPDTSVVDSAAPEPSAPNASVVGSSVVDSARSRPSPIRRCPRGRWLRRRSPRRFRPPRPPRRWTDRTTPDGSNGLRSQNSAVTESSCG